MFTDPSGLDVRYIQTGPSLGNVWNGHSAIYIDGFGLFSLNGGAGGINLYEGVSLEEYIAQNEWRGASVYHLNTTPKQDKDLGRFFLGWDAECDTAGEVNNYCSGLTCAAIIDVGMSKYGILPSISKTGKFVPDTREWLKRYLPANLLGRLQDAGATLELQVLPTAPDPLTQGRHDALYDYYEIQYLNGNPNPWP